MSKLRKILLLSAALFTILHLVSNEVIAQSTQAKATADTSQILIGDHVNLVLEINQLKDKKFDFPIFRDTIVDKIEVLSVSPIDTLELEDRLKLRQHLVVTSFDTGFYVIPSFVFRDRLNNDSVKTNALPLEVHTLEIDTTKGITDIKLPFDVPLSFWEIAPYIFVALILLAIAIFLYFYYKKKRQEEKVAPVRAKPVEPAHLWALRELDKLSKEKLWQKGKIKLYHSRITDILRSYIEFRFDIPAMEYTTSETISECSTRKEISDELRSNLALMLELADLVKFAKWNPMPDENEQSEQIAYDFVLKTKLTPVLRKSDEQKTDSVEDNMKGKEGENVE